MTSPLARFASLAALAVAGLLAASSTAAAQSVPQVGEGFTWPTLRDWLDGAPAQADTAGKVVVHWFCKPRSEACKDDLARMYNLREQNSGVYVVAYIDGNKRDAKKLDPVRAEVGAGAVAFGKPVKTMLKKMGIAGALPVSIVVDTDGKVALVSTTADLDQLDARDAKITALVKAVTEFTTKTSGPTAPLKPGVKFDLTVEVQLASWLAFNNMVPEVFIPAFPPDVTCDTKMRRGRDVKIELRTLTAKFTCSSTVKGAYEIRASLRFGYDAPNKATGVGEDNVSWKFEIKP